MSRSDELMERAVKYIPGGVNSPVRSYRNVGLTPRFIQKAKGPYIFDADGKQYVDYICSWGPMILGHDDDRIREKVLAACERGLSYGAATETEVDIAEFICENIPHVEMIRMVNSGTEAVMSAIRAARGFTGKDKIVKFAGNYHGHSDCLLVDAGSGLMTQGIPGSAGVPAGCTKDTLSAQYNDLDSVKRLFASNKGEIAAVIVEPLAANMGVVKPEKGFLAGLREICDAEDAVLIFDEVITGFRLAFGGAAEFYGITPDMVTYGKIIGGGMPVGAYGGRRDIMEKVAPLGPVYQAGTLSGNPVAMAAGLEELHILYEHPEYYSDLQQKGRRLFGGMEQIIRKYKAPCTMNYEGSLGSLFFSEEEVMNYAQASASDTTAFARYFKGMLERGIHLAPSQFEAIFISVAHDDKVLDETLQAFEAVISEMSR